MKDTMQLNYLTKNRNNLLGNAYLVNEDLPKYIVSKIKKIKNFKSKKVLVLGKTFKANNDDLRGSKSLDLIRLLNKNKIKNVVYEPNLERQSKKKVNSMIKFSKIIILATPHKEFKNLKISKDKTLIDISGFFLKG